MSDTIIAGLDLDSPQQARDALSLATWLADVTASNLLLVTIFAPHGGALSTQLERRRRELAALADRPVETMAIAGTAPARLLHELADQRRPRALVIGSSRSGAEGAVSVGSAGELLLHGGDAPVVVAPHGFVAPAGRAIGVKDNMALVGILSTQLLIERFIRTHSHADHSARGTTIRGGELLVRTERR